MWGSLAQRRAIPTTSGQRAPAGAALLCRDRCRVHVDLRGIAVDRTVSAVTARREAAGLVRRAEPGPAGPLLLEAQAVDDGVVLHVWGPPATPAAVVAEARDAAVGWAGLHDQPSSLRDAVAGHPPLARLARLVGEVRLSRLPRLGEALGRAVLEQLVQSAEARRSIAQVARRVGTPAGGGLWCWPTAAQMGATPSWALRRYGVSARGSRALHAGAVEDARLERARRVAASAGDWDDLDRRLRALPGVGAWTSAEVRLRLGDPDAVSVGDLHLPTLVGDALGGARPGSRPAWTDADLLALLAPFAGQRGRVIRLLECATARGLLQRRRRRAPRAALSAHRYW